MEDLAYSIRVKTCVSKFPLMGWDKEVEDLTNKIASYGTEIECKEWFSWAWKLSGVAVLEPLSYWFLLESSCTVVSRVCLWGGKSGKEPYFSSGKNFGGEAVQAHADRSHQQFCEVEWKTYLKCFIYHPSTLLFCMEGALSIQRKKTQWTPRNFQEKHFCPLKSSSSPQTRGPTCGTQATWVVTVKVFLIQQRW